MTCPMEKYQHRFFSSRVRVRIIVEVPVRVFTGWTTALSRLLLLVRPGSSGGEEVATSIADTKAAPGRWNQHLSLLPSRRDRDLCDGHLYRPWGGYRSVKRWADMSACYRIPLFC